MTACIEGPVIRATFFFNLQTQHCCVASWKALLAVLPPTSNIVTRQNLLLQVEKFFLKKVDASSTWCNMLLQLTTMKFCRVTMFEMGGNTCNNAFQLATQQCCVQVEEKYCPYYRDFTIEHVLAYCSFTQFLKCETANYFAALPSLRLFSNFKSTFDPLAQIDFGFRSSLSARGFLSINFIPSFNSAGFSFSVSFLMTNPYVTGTRRDL